MKVAGICLITVIFSALLKKYNPDLSLVMVTGLCLSLLLFLGSIGEKISDFLQEIYGWAGLTGEIFTPLLKTAGIALISHTGGNLCRDAEQKAVASLLETVGAFLAILAAVPLWKQVWDVIQNLL